MANTYEKQFLFSKYGKLTLRSGTVTFGGSDSATTVSGPGLNSVKKLTTGVYQIKFKDNFYNYVSSDFQMLSGTTGSPVGDGTFTTNTIYQITTIGTSNWSAIGYDSDYTPVVGGVFVASGTGNGGTFTGQASAITPSTINIVEVIQSPQSELTNLNASSGTKGSSIFIQTLGPTGGTTSSSTVLLAANPVAGAQLIYNIWFADTSVKQF